MKVLKVLPYYCSLFLISPACAMEESPIPLLIESLGEEANTATYAALFKNCAAVNNALLNTYKDMDRGNDASLVDVIEEQSDKSARFVELASIFALEVERAEVETAALARGMVGGTSVDNLISIFNESYYDMLRYYENAAQNRSLSAVRISHNEDAFIVGIDYFIEECDKTVAQHLEI